MKLKLVIAALLLALPGMAGAWWDVGHMTTALVAYQRLSPATKAECDRLIAVPVDPASAQARANTFVTAACWADDAKGQLGTGTWHYFDIAFSDDGTTPTLKHDEKNLIWALDHCAATLRDKAASDTDKGVALRYIIHFMGDIHQPLHDAARCTAEHPSGDQGGNLFPVKTTLSTTYNGKPSPVTQLHKLWDSGCGLMKDTPQRPLDANAIALLEGLAATFTEANPPDEHAKKVEPFMELSQEGYKQARNVVYDGIKPGGEPSDEYMERGQRLVGQQVAFGGYRLANLLNGIFDPAAQPTPAPEPTPGSMARPAQ